MGQTHILEVREDALRGLTPETRTALASEIGEAVIKSTIDPDQMQTPEGLVEVLDYKVGNHSGAIRRSAQVHSTELRPFVWAQNCLVDIADAHLDNLESAMKSIQDEIAKRA